jgi:hypothetical protein
MNSGAPKNDKLEKKHRLELLPMDLLGFVADAYEYGCSKYYHNSHRKGFDTDRMISGALRHISDWNDRGQEFDKDAHEQTGMKVHHIGMAIFNLLCVLESTEYYPERVKNFIRMDFSPEVPIDDLPALTERIENLRKYWAESPQKTKGV